MRACLHFPLWRGLLSRRGIYYPKCQNDPGFQLVHLYQQNKGFMSTGGTFLFLVPEEALWWPTKVAKVVVNILQRIPLSVYMLGTVMDSWEKLDKWTLLIMKINSPLLGLIEACHLLNFIPLMVTLLCWLPPSNNLRTASAIVNIHAWVFQGSKHHWPTFPSGPFDMCFSKRNLTGAL